MGTLRRSFSGNLCPLSFFACSRIFCVAGFALSSFSCEDVRHHKSKRMHANLFNGLGDLAAELPVASEGLHLRRHQSIRMKGKDTAPHAGRAR
jgi:hypothetical protein